MNPFKRPLGKIALSVLPLKNGLPASRQGSRENLIPVSEHGMTKRVGFNRRAGKQEMDYNINMQFQIPQFIETEDKVIGPLTIRQFIYVGTGAGICAMLYFMLATWLWAIFSIIIMVSVAAVAFIKIDGRPFINIILSAFNFYWKPQAYFWQSEQQPMKKEDHPTLGATIQNIAAGLALHKSWESIQTGTKTSNAQTTERYQILQKQSGERRAAKRVDYR